MGNHPLNLGLRFILEMCALASMAMWGWDKGEAEWQQYLLSIGIPIFSATLWGIFAVPNDPSRSGNAPIVTPGIIRLILELIFFAYATWNLYDLGYSQLSLSLGIVVFGHYLVSYDRVLWLLSNKKQWDDKAA